MGRCRTRFLQKKGVTPDDHYEKLAPGLWGIVHGTIRTMWAAAGFIWASPPGLFPRNSCIILKKVPHYNGHRRNRLLRCILQGIPKDLQGAANRDIGMIPGMQAGQKAKSRNTVWPKNTVACADCPLHRLHTSHGFPLRYRGLPAYHPAPPAVYGA